MEFSQITSTHKQKPGSPPSEGTYPAQSLRETNSSFSELVAQMIQTPVLCLRGTDWAQEDSESSEQRASMASCMPETLVIAPTSVCTGSYNKAPRLGALNNGGLFSHHSGSSKSKMKVLVGLVSPEASLLDWRMAPWDFSLCIWGRCNVSHNSSTPEKLLAQI